MLQNLGCSQLRLRSAQNCGKIRRPKWMLHKRNFAIFWFKINCHVRIIDLFILNSTKSLSAVLYQVIACANANSLPIGGSIRKTNGAGILKIHIGIYARKTCYFEKKSSYETQFFGLYHMFLQKVDFWQVYWQYLYISVVIKFPMKLISFHKLLTSRAPSNMD